MNTKLAFSTDGSQLQRRHRKAKFFANFCATVTWLGTALLLLLMYQIFSDGFRWLDWQFITSFPSRFPERAGIKSALYGTIWLISLIAFFAIPIGVATAIFIEEFSPQGKLRSFIEVNIANLAGVPSIVYGIIGLTIFVRGLNLERSLISGALTMSLLILPVIIIASREAIRTVQIGRAHV